jgi:hypothetical protein
VRVRDGARHQQLIERIDLSAQLTGAVAREPAQVPGQDVAVVGAGRRPAVGAGILAVVGPLTVGQPDVPGPPGERLGYGTEAVAEAFQAGDVPLS